MKATYCSLQVAFQYGIVFGMTFHYHEDMPNLVLFIGPFILRFFKEIEEISL